MGTECESEEVDGEGTAVSPIEWSVMDNIPTFSPNCLERAAMSLQYGSDGTRLVLPLETQATSFLNEIRKLDTQDSPSGIGILGGSFDPVHVGHLWMAEAALEQLPIDHVRWFPAATSPLKPRGPVASNEQRLQMLQLTLSGHDQHQIDTWELDQDEVSYTVHTLQYLADQFPNRPLFLIIGADSLAAFDRWKEPEEILRRCTPAVIRRGGEPDPDFSILEPFADRERIQQIQATSIAMPQIEISSSELRRRAEAGKSLRFRVPHAVRALIAGEKLYSNQKSL